MTKNNFSCFADLVNQLEFTGGFENEWSHRWECTDGTSNKYWELYHPEGDRDTIHVRWGRIGNNPQSVVKTWSEAAKKVPQKLRKGYTDEGGWVNVAAGVPFIAGNLICDDCEVSVPEDDICSETGDYRCGDCCDCKFCCAIHDSLPPPFNQIARFGVAAGSNGAIRIAMNKRGAEVLRMPKEAAEKFAREHLS